MTFLKRKSMRLITLLFSLTATILVLFLWWAVGKSLPKEAKLTVHSKADPTEFPSKSTLTFATYNVGHGQGVKAHATDWVDEDVTRLKLDELTKVLRTMDADLVLLQEVDLDSNRSHRINQAQTLLEKTDYPYWACAILWDENYLPFPLWPVGHQLGEIKSANCILSRYPLGEHRRLVFDKPESNPFWYNWGYLDRGIQFVDVTVGKKRIFVANLHLEAYDPDTRQKQAREMIRWLSQVEDPLVIGGDFNSLPPEATEKNGFVDQPEADFTSDNTIQIVRQGLTPLTEAISSGQYLNKEQSTFTFPANAPTRRLDYLFAFRGAKVLSGRVFHEAADASDHLPVIATIGIRE